MVTQLCRDVNRHKELLSLVLGTFNFACSLIILHCIHQRGKRKQTELSFPMEETLYTKIRWSIRLNAGLISSRKLGGERDESERYLYLRDLFKLDLKSGGINHERKLSIN